MTNFNERQTIGDLVLSERPNFTSRNTGPLKLGAGVLILGTVLGLLTKDLVTLPVVAGNTGDGVVTLAETALGSFAEVGNYTLTCITESANGGKFQVVSPSGYRLPDLTVGVPYVGDHINLTVADGAEDWDIDDVIIVNVAGSNKYVPAQSGAVDGSAIGEAVLLQDVDTTAADVPDVLLLTDGPVTVADHELKYHVSANTPEKRLAIRAGLEAKGFRFVQSA